MFIHKIIPSIPQVRAVCPVTVRYLLRICHSFTLSVSPTQNAWAGAVEPPVGWCVIKRRWKLELLLPFHMNKGAAEASVQSQISCGRRELCSRCIGFHRRRRHLQPVPPSLEAGLQKTDCSHQSTNLAYHEAERKSAMWSCTAYMGLLVTTLGRVPTPYSCSERSYCAKHTQKNLDIAHAKWV